MLCHVFKPKGSRVFRGRYRLSNGPKIYDVPLGVDKRHVALARVNQLRLEGEAELLGQVAPKAIRDAAQQPISAHLEAYVGDLGAQQRSRKHVALARNRVTRLCTECGWKILSDVTSADFSKWRAAQSLAPKTTNEYLGLASAFFNWLVRQGRVATNPLAQVSKAETRGKERRLRRALSDKEIELLIRSSGKRGLPYFLAAYTGLRRGEIKALVWGDLHLDGPEAFVVARASTTKNKQTGSLPLVPELASALREYRKETGASEGKVFRNGLPSVSTLKQDLAACGIVYANELGERVDFHALRHTFCTSMHRSGVSQRAAQELMRHSDSRLTAKTYTDARLLPLITEIRKVPAPSLGASLNFGKSRPVASKGVQREVEREIAETPIPESESLALASVGQTCPNCESGGVRGFLTRKAVAQIIL